MDPPLPQLLHLTASSRPTALFTAAQPIAPDGWLTLCTLNILFACLQMPILIIFSLLQSQITKSISLVQSTVELLRDEEKFGKTMTISRA